MGSRQIVGIVLLVVGAAVLVMGWNASRSLTEQVSETFTGRYSRETTIYLVGGGAAAVLGLVMLLTGRSRS